MTRNIVFLTHGMGRHEPGTWAEPWIKSIIENLQLYSPYSGMTRSQIESDFIDFVPINYDHVFEDRFRTRWNDLAGAFADVSLPSGLTRVLKWIESEGESEIFWDYLLDPLLWYLSAQARKSVIVSVARQIAEAVAEAKGTGATYNFISHSLGCSVIHDTLLSLSDSEITDGVFDSETSGIQWKSMTQIANVSRLLRALNSPSNVIPHANYSPHTSRVRPGNGGLVKRFVDSRHMYDPFTFPRAFKPDWAKYSGHVFRVLERFDSPKNVHDFSTHFDCPGVHQVTLGNVLGTSAIVKKSSENKDAWDRYDRLYARDVSSELSEFRLKLEPSSERKMGPVELAAYLLDITKFIKP